jgi:hypothetical protein
VSNAKAHFILINAGDYEGNWRIICDDLNFVVFDPSCGSLKPRESVSIECTFIGEVNSIILIKLSFFLRSLEKKPNRISFYSTHQIEM